MKETWKVLGKKMIFKHPHASVCRWHVRLPSGKTENFYIKEGQDFVVVFALTPEKKVVAVQQYYINIEATVWSLVAGFCDKKETPKKAAARELLEETGYRAKKIIVVGRGCKGKYQTGHPYYCLALDAVRVAPQKLEPTEQISVHEISLQKFHTMLDKNMIPDAYTELGARRALDYIEAHPKKL